MEWFDYLKEKCIDCYNLNKDTEPETIPFVPDNVPIKKGTIAEFFKDKKILISLYCEEHQKKIDSLINFVEPFKSK